MDKNTQQTNTTDTDKIFGDISAEMKTRFDLLPEELKTAILSSEFQMKLYEIAKKHKITYEKLGKLEMETTMVLLGMTPPDEYSLELKEQIEVSEGELKSIVHEVNEQVFKPIRDSLMKLYKKEEVEEGEKLNTVQNEKLRMNNAGLETNKDNYREPMIDIPKTQTAPIQMSTPSKPIAPTENLQNKVPMSKPEQSPGDKVAELKKSLSQAVNGNLAQTETPKPTAPLSGSRMSVSEIIQKAGDLKPNLSEGVPKSTPVELNSGTEKMVSSMDSGKPYGMHTMPKTIETMADQPEKVMPVSEKNKGLIGQIKSMFSEPKEPIDVIIKKDVTQSATPTLPPQSPTGDKYHEPI